MPIAEHLVPPAQSKEDMPPEFVPTNTSLKAASRHLVRAHGVGFASTAILGSGSRGSNATDREGNKV
jgi:hypothetical protein